MKILKRIIVITFLIDLCLVASFFAYYFSVTTNTKLNINKLNIYENSVVIFDNNDKEVATFSTQGERDCVKLEEIPDIVVKAFVSVEDKRFYKHKGIDYLRLIKASLNNLKSNTFGEGGSTITQQLIKNTHLNSEKTIERKLKEIKLAKQLEKKFSKEEILEMYLNTIYFGHGLFGISSASKYYFDKDVSSLNLSEGAMLAGIIKAPSYYSPFKDDEKCLLRRNTVLSVMNKQGIISEREYQNAIKEELPQKPFNANLLKCYNEQVYNELDEIALDLGLEKVNSLQIHTYLQSDLQAEVEQIVSQDNYNNLDKSVVIIDNKTRGIKAFYSTIGNAKRLPASTIKPLLVYAPAFEKGIVSPATKILDEKTNFNGYSPSNFNDKYYGYTSIRESIAQSSNVVSVKLLNQVGINDCCDYLENMNLPVDNEDRTLALGLGAMKLGYTLKEICGGFSTLACNGEFSQPHFIKSIYDEKGNLIYEDKKEVKKVFSKETCYLMDDVLSYTAKYGTARRLKSCDYEICAKTGTNGIKDGNFDAYSIAYTTQDTFGVWLGNADGKKADILGGREPCDIIYNVQEIVYKNEKPSPFSKPDGIKECKLDKFAYENNQKLIIADQNAPPIYTFTDIFNEVYLPTEQSTDFTKPKLQNTKICVNENVEITTLGNKNVYIIITRESNGTEKTIYNGKIKEKFFDEIDYDTLYKYTITPYIKVYDEVIYGDKVPLPEIKKIKNEEKESIIKRQWWIE